jgi:hypothetical protein
MSAILPSRFHGVEVPQAFSSQRRASPSVLTELDREHPKVLITGDIRLRVTEAEAALHPITGHYSVQMTAMQEPVYTLWHAEGQVLHRQGRSTCVVFDMHGARAGETRIYLVAVQVAECGAQGRVVLSGVFVRVVVTGDDHPFQHD